MLIAPLPQNEAERLQAVYALRLLDTAPEERFDAVARMAARIFKVPIAFVSLIERDRQWLKARVGIEVSETPREVSFCSHAILQDEPLIISDTQKDARFSDSPFVTGEPFVRFYAGTPLRSAGGQKIGTLCIADQEPHEFPAELVKLLWDLGALVERELNMTDLLEAQKQLLDTRNQLEDELAAAEKYVQSLLPAPLTAPVEIDWRFLPSQQLGGDCLGYQYLASDKLAFFMLDVCGHGVGAALLSVALLSTIRSQALRGADFHEPASVLAALNREFPMERHENRFFTVWYGVLDLSSRQLTYAAAGHPPAIIIPAEGPPRRLPSQSIPIGCLPDSTYHNSTSSFDPGESFFLFSDGAFELRGSDHALLSFEEMEALLTRSAQSPAPPLDSVLAELQQISGRTRFVDDVTLLSLRVSDGN